MTARQLAERDVDRVLDVACLPFCVLADVDHDNGLSGEQFGRTVGVDLLCPCDEAHGSGLRCALDDCCEPIPHLGGDREERFVADDREHSLGVDCGDVRLAAALVDDDVARQQGAEVGLGFERLVGEGRVAAPRIR